MGDYLQHTEIRFIQSMVWLIHEGVWKTFITIKQMQNMIYEWPDARPISQLLNIINKTENPKDHQHGDKLHKMNMTEQEKYYKSLNEELEQKALQVVRKREAMEKALKDQEVKSILKVVIVLMILGLFAWAYITIYPILEKEYSTSTSAYDSPILTPQMKSIVNTPKEGYVIDSETGELRPMNAMEYGFKIGFDGATRK